MPMEHWSEAFNPTFIPKTIKTICCVACCIVVLGIVLLSLSIYNGTQSASDMEPAEIAFDILLYGGIGFLVIFSIGVVLRLSWFCCTKKQRVEIV